VKKQSVNKTPRKVLFNNIPNMHLSFNIYISKFILDCVQALIQIAYTDLC